MSRHKQARYSTINTLVKHGEKTQYKKPFPSLYITIQIKQRGKMFPRVVQCTGEQQQAQSGARTSGKNPTLSLEDHAEESDSYISYITWERASITANETCSQLKDWTQNAHNTSTVPACACTSCGTDKLIKTGSFTLPGLWNRGGLYSSVSIPA